MEKGSEGTVFVQEPTPRDFYLKKDDVIGFGVTQGCGGCRYYRTRVKQGHTRKCKERFRGLLGERARVKLAAEKKTEWTRRQEHKFAEVLEEEKKGAGGVEGYGNRDMEIEVAAEVPLTIETTPTGMATAQKDASSSSTGLPGDQPVRIDREGDDSMGVCEKGSNKEEIGRCGAITEKSWRSEERR